jgi:hypothetical protein
MAARQRYRQGDRLRAHISLDKTPIDETLQAVLCKIIIRSTKLLTRRGALIEEQGSTYLADHDGDSDGARMHMPPQAVVCTYRIAFGPPAGQKVLTGGARRDAARHRLQAGSVRRLQRVQRSRRRALQCRWAQVVGATLPLRHSSGAAQRTDAMQRRWASPADAQDALP